MKITSSFLLVFIACFFTLFGITSYIVNEQTEKSIINTEVEKMNAILFEKELEIENLNNRAIGDMIFALKNPAFVDYFELDDTKKGNQYDHGVMQFTSKQNEIKSELEQWIFHFQNKFQVDETCIIDTTGQEHARLVLKNIAPNSDLSSEESSAPFFDESFRKEIDQAHIQYPYISPDTNRWVFAYTSPVVLGDGEKPAFYHFEMPVSIFQDLISIENGRMYVIDSDGVLIADSDYVFSDDTLEFDDYFPSASIISNSNEFETLISDMQQNKMGISSYVENENTHHVVYEHLSLFDWILVYDLDDSKFLTSNQILHDVRNSILYIFTIVGSVAVLGFYFASKKISRPINSLISECNNLNPQKLFPLNLNLTEEFEPIKNSINNMIEKIFLNEEKIKNHLEKIESQHDEITAQNEEIEFQNQELSKALTKTEKLQKQKEEFTAMMTHELKTPLTPILMWVQMFSSKRLGDLSEKQEKAINKIENSTKTLLKLITDMLDVHKLELNQLKFNKENTDTKKITSNLISNYEVMMKNNNIEFIFSNIENVPLTTDKERIEQALRIFITNAMDFVSKKGRIELKVSLESEFVKFSVIDNGVGISKDNISKLFTKFYQVDTKIDRKYGGTGLGLAVAKGIAEGLGGEIGVKSELGKGSEFFVKIPTKSKLVKEKSS